jgi:hypothetical protein
VKPLAGGAGVRVNHAEGIDWLLCSPGVPAALDDGSVHLKGEIALVRKDPDGEHWQAVRLAVMRGEASCDGWTLRSDGAASLRATPQSISGESSGPAHAVVIRVPKDKAGMPALLDGKALPVRWEGDTVTLALPAGDHQFMLVIER